MDRDLKFLVCGLQSLLVLYQVCFCPNCVGLGTQRKLGQDAENLVLLFNTSGYKLNTWSWLSLASVATLHVCVMC